MRPLRPLLVWLAPRLMLGLARLRVWRGQETAADLAERRGTPPAAFAAPGGAVWLHGASNGELASARWVIEALAARGALHVTASTVTGREMVRGWGIAGVTTSLAPLDLKPALQRFLARSPRAFLNLEGEFWPQRFAALAAREVPVALIGARMSARSAGFWEGAAGFLQAVTLASAQDEASAARLVSLGLDPAALAPVVDLKAEAMARRPAPASLPRAARAGTLLAASTHAGEEAPVLAAFAASGLDRLILAPRHPRRGDEIAREIARQGLPCARRSAGADLPATGVYLADTMGEMELWYAAAGICFVGGSLVAKGGHTPWEPARHGCALLHGPRVENFEDAYAALGAAGAAQEVTEATFGATLRALDSPAQEAMAAAAADLRKTGGGEALLAALLSLIDGK